MNHVFCTECGSKIQYSYSKPKFCSSCGHKIGSSAQLLKKSQSNVQEEQFLSEDETSIDELPDISRLQVDLEQYTDNVFTFGSLVGEESSKPSTRRRGSRSLEDFIDAKKR